MSHDPVPNTASVAEGMTLIVSILRYDKRLGGLFMNQAVITTCHHQTCGIFSTISLISHYPDNVNET
jgi:hypothetical protein